MLKLYTKDLMIVPSMTDATGKLDYAQCFDLFMDIATEHAEEIGVGLSALGPKGQYWLTVKSKVRFYRRPSLIERVQLSTWPESSKRVACMRDYRMSRGGEVLAEGRTQWAVLDVKQGTLVDVRELYPDDWNLQDETFRVEKFSRFRLEFDEAPFASYTIASTDIDLGKHMNNVAYLRVLERAFTTKQWKALEPSEIEIHFIKQCFEGETLELRRKEDGSILYVEGRVEDRTAFVIRLDLEHQQGRT